MEEEIPGNGYSWEESIYWNHFHSIHFYLPLTGDFLHQLGLPKKFVENMRAKLADTVVIKGPGRSTWRVGLAAQGDNLLFREGWSEFVSDHKLKEHDLLLFKFIGESRFEVLMFDSQNFCEKESSYFLNRSGVDNGSGANLSPSRASKKVDEDSKDVENAAKVFDLMRNRTSRKSARTASNDDDSGDSPITFTTSRKRPLAASPISTVLPKAKSGEKKFDYCNLMSIKNQRTVTTMNEEQKLAVHSAQAAAVDGNSFIIVMRPTHVDRKFYLSIPVDWTNKHLDQRNQDIILRVKDKTWPTRYYISSRKTGGLASGWKKFAFDNGLEVPDVCLFKLSSDNETGPVCLDVTIFKSSQETPPAILLDVEDDVEEEVGSQERCD